MKTRVFYSCHWELMPKPDGRRFSVCLLRRGISSSCRGYKTSGRDLSSINDSHEARTMPEELGSSAAGKTILLHRM
jgi:hypothetical protein